MAAGASCLVALLALLTLGACHRAASGPVRVAAAADLAFVFAELGQAFEARTGHKVIFTFGSTGELTKALLQKQPFDVLAAPNVPLVEFVTEAGVCDPKTTQLYARGRLVLWSRPGGAITPTSGPADLERAEVKKIAISDPDHSAHGMATMEALEAAGVWTRIQPKLVYLPNVKRSLELVEAGGADVAVTALALVVAAHEGVHAELDQATYRPLNQALVLCGHGSNLDGARQFTAFVTSPEGRAVMLRYGYAEPSAK